MQRGPVVPEGLADALGVEHDEAGVGLFLQLELRQVDALGGVDGDEDDQPESSADGRPKAAVSILAAYKASGGRVREPKAS